MALGGRSWHLGERSSGKFYFVSFGVRVTIEHTLYRILPLKVLPIAAPSIESWKLQIDVRMVAVVSTNFGVKHGPTRTVR